MASFTRRLSKASTPAAARIACRGIHLDSSYMCLHSHVAAVSKSHVSLNGLVVPSGSRNATIALQWRFNTRRLLHQSMGCFDGDRDSDKSTNLFEEDYTKYVESTIQSLQRKVRECHAAGDYETGLTAAEKAKEVVERHYGKANPIYASCLNNIALFTKLLGDIERSTSMYESTVQAYVDVVGMEHPSTAVALHNLAMCIKMRVQQASGLDKVMLLEQAKTGFEDAIASQTAVLKNNPNLSKFNLVSSQINLASTLRELNKEDEARNILHDVLNEWEESSTDRDRQSFNNQCQPD